jgi:uncharacterized protein YjbI with pentapeptide repeats
MPHLKVVEAMSTKHGTGRDARRIARRESRLDEKFERTGKKKEPLLSPFARNVLLAIIAVILLTVGSIWFYNDSQGFVAKVDGRRIVNEEYSYFLKLQQNVVETREGLTGKTEAERQAFWSKSAVEGQNPILSVKNAALDNAKEYVIQLQKAKAAGLAVDANITSQAKSYIDSIKQSQGADVFAANLTDMGLTEARYLDILQNYYLIDTFKAKYMNDNYKQADITDEAIQAAYDADPKQYDKVSARIIYLTKAKADGTTLDDATLAIKKKTAEDLLAQLTAGADMATLAKEQSESTTAKDDGGLQEMSYDMQPYEPEIIDWAFAAKAGELKLLDTTYGIFVVRMESRKGFSDAKETIRTDMISKAREDFYTAALDGWMKEPKYNVVLKNKVFERFTVQ